MSFHILFSPTKNLRTDFAKRFPVESTPAFIEEASILHDTLIRMRPKAVQAMMKISDKIASEVSDRLAEWKDAEPTPAIFTYDGEAFRGLSPETLDEKALQLAQERLVILSGLYGMLKPLDGIKPYRLEMQTKMKVGKQVNLYHFWNHKMAKALEPKSEFLLNLASEEYSKVILPFWDRKKVVSPVFMEWNDGNPKTVMMYAKHARGKMLHYILKENLKELEPLKAYTLDGYVYTPSLSDEQRWVFTR